MASAKYDKTPEILKIFEDISRIPRCSGHEERIGTWLLEWAQQQNFEAKRDEVGNVLIKVPATKGGYAKSKTVVLQGHLDMVCEKTLDSTHDFSNDPLELVKDGEWLRANGTTLGADNGIAIALALALVLDEKVKHPPLELLFTVEEETGMRGAREMAPDFISGRTLINLDSEGDGQVFIGCAGGQSTTMALPLEYDDVPDNYMAYHLQAGGMRGGHSGVDIHQGYANAIRVTCRALQGLIETYDARISFIGGGTVGNAIPRNAEAVVFLPAEQHAQANADIAALQETLRNEYSQTDAEITVTFTSYNEAADNRAMTACSSKKSVDFLQALPHGVENMSAEFEGLVETSNNLATVKVEEGRLKVLTSQRSSVKSRLLAHTARIEAVARLAGVEVSSTPARDPWEADWDSPLLALCQKVYGRVFRRKKMAVKMIHGGLECALFKHRYPEMDMVSVGPTLQNPHSPGERLHIDSVGKTWDFLVSLLRSLK